SAAATVAKANPSMKRPKSAAPIPSPMPTPRAVTFFFSSNAASSSSSLAIADAWSATCFAAPPTPAPFVLVPWVGMPPPIDDLGEHVPRCERGPDHEPRARAVPPPAARTGALELRPGGRAPDSAGRLVGRSLALRARLDQARLQLPEEVRVLGQGCADLRLHAAGRLRLPHERVELVGRALDCLIRLRHFFVGGSSPVATRQILDASLRAAIVEAAPRPAYRPVQRALRSMRGSSPT